MTDEQEIIAVKLTKEQWESVCAVLKSLLSSMKFIAQEQEESAANDGRDLRTCNIYNATLQQSTIVSKLNVDVLRQLGAWEEEKERQKIK